MHASISIRRSIPCFLLFIQAANGCGDFQRHNSSAGNTNNNEQMNGKSSGDTQAKPNNLDPKSWSEKLDGLKSSAAKIASDVNRLNLFLSQIFEVKNSLCTRQAQLFSSCIVHAPLAPSIWRAAAACRVEQRVWDNRSFRAKIQGVSGKFKLILDNTIESNPFEAGEERSLSWTSTGHRDLRDLKFSDVGSMKIKAVEGDLPDLKTAQFSFKIDNNTLLTQEHILNGTRTQSSIVLSTLPLIDMLSSAECRVADNELDALSQEAIARASSPMPVTVPEENPKAAQDEIAVLFEDWLFSATRLQQNRTDTFLAIAQDISRLRRDLRGDLQLGCWSKEQIKTIELRIKGSHLPLSDWDRASTKKKLTSTGKPRQTTIDLGGGLRFSNPDEGTFPLFRDEGRWLLSVSTDLTLGDINNIQIKKDGVGYQSFNNCWSTWGGLKTACEWQNRETDRYQLSGLSVLINGQKIYDRNAINFDFQKSSLTWIEKELTANPSYIELMRRRDCPVSLGSI
jgi:hypothetical protein